MGDEMKRGEKPMKVQYKNEILKSILALKTTAVVEGVQVTHTDAVRVEKFKRNLSRRQKSIFEAKHMAEQISWATE